MADDQTTVNPLLTFISSLSSENDTTKVLKQLYRMLFDEPMKPVPIERPNPTLPITRCYKEVPPIPPSRVANKARVYPSPTTPLSNIPNVLPQYINDALKPPGERFRYFQKPTIPTNRGDYTEIIKEFIVHDTNYSDKANDNAVLSEIKDKLAANGLDIIPPEVYSYNWRTFNKQFIINRCRNTGTYISSPSAIVDPYVMHTLKLIYPNVSEHILRRDYTTLMIKHNLVDSGGSSFGTKDQTAISLLINENPLIARLASLLSQSSNVSSLNDTISSAIETVPDQSIIAKFPCINKNIIQRDMIVCKLAFLCGSTNDTIIGDIELVRRYIKLLVAQLPHN